MKVESVSGTRPIIRVNNPDIKNSEKLNGKNRSRADAERAQPDGKQETASIGEEKLIEAIENANKALRNIDRRFEFSIHEATKEIMVKVINDETEEVIREIPPEKILDMVAKMWELAGILVDRKV